MAHARAYKRHKQRMTVSLSSEATKYARGLRAEIKVPTMSALFEELIRDFQRRTELEQLEARTVAYYDSLSPETQAVDAAWADAGQAGLASIFEDEAPAEHTKHEHTNQLLAANR
jgi:hypothetical protein